MSGHVSPGSMPFHGGLLVSHIAGRTDRLNVDVPSGCYVIPADIVSGLGEGNTMAGAKKLDHFLGTPKPIMLRPCPMVPIVAAGGEFVVHPWRVAQLGMGAAKPIEFGHKVLDIFVKERRSHLVKTLAKLPGPQK